jgi:predicted dehydrogenase
MTTQLSAGVIGLGILGRQHAEFLHAHPAVTVTAVSDIRQSVAEDVAQQLGSRSYGDYGEMFENERLDLVVVATPDHLHREPTLAAIAAGVPNIIQEKPLATSLADANAIYDAAERVGTRFFVDFSNRASPLDIATRYVIQDGLLGQMVYAEARLDDNISVPTQMWGDRTREFAAGSSTAHFLLSHVVDLLRWYFSPAEVTDVFAVSQSMVLGYTPDLYDAFLTFDSGVKVRVKAEWIKHIDQLVEFYMCFSGSEGTLVYNKNPGFGVSEGWRANVSGELDVSALLAHQDALRKLGVNASALVHHPAPSTGQLAAGGGHEALALEATEGTYGGTMGLIPPIIDAILEGVPEPASWQGRGQLPTHIDGLRQTQVVMALIASSESGEPVTVG